MAIDGGFNLSDKLSLDQAKLVARSRINNLGSYELTLNYNVINSNLKEDALEWLEQNRLTVTNPIFSNKEYEGTWSCVSISYDENRSIIQQVFKIDSQVGDLGDIVDEPNYGSQSGDTSRISAGMEIQKAYYWKVVNPTDIVLPTSAREGEIWTKTQNDNGDGTYDVVVAREIANNLTANNAAQFGGTNNSSTDILVSGAGTTSVDGTYALTGTSSGKDYWYDGTSYYIYWSTTDGGAWFIATSIGSGVQYRVISLADFPPTTGWTSIAGIDPAPKVVSDASVGGPYNEQSQVNTNTDETAFVSDSGSEPDAIDGQIKTITNSPLENGKYRTDVTTRTAKPVRMPAQEGTFFEYSSDGWQFPAKSMIVGRNRSYDEMTTDAALLSTNIYYLNRINNVSVRINDFGLYDYTITSNEPG